MEKNLAVNKRWVGERISEYPPFLTIYRRGLQALGRLFLYFRRSAFLEYQQLTIYFWSALYNSINTLVNKIGKVIG